MTVTCPKCETTFGVDYSGLSDLDSRVRCPGCQTQYLLKTGSSRKEVKSDPPSMNEENVEGSKSTITIGKERFDKLMSISKAYENQRQALIDCTGNLLDTKIALDEREKELAETTAKLHMLEDTLRGFRRMKWWRRLFWRG